MNEDTRIREEIAAGEAWLRAIVIDPEPPEVERLERAVAVAIDERWLAERIGEESSAVESERTRRAVARVVSLERWHRRWRGGGTTIVRGGLGLAAAAMLSWLVLLPWLGSSRGAHEKYLDAFDSYVHTESNLDVELATIDDALFDLEMTSMAESVDGWEDSVLSGLSDDIDRLWDDGES